MKTKCFTVPLDLEGKEIGENIVEQLKNNNLFSEGRLVRHFSLSQLERMTNIGTDRDKNSDIYHGRPINVKRKEDYKTHQAMIKNELNPEKNKDKVTFCYGLFRDCRIEPWIYRCYDSSDPVEIAVYDEGKLKLIAQTDFYMFCDNPKNALLAVFLREGREPTSIAHNPH